MMVASKLIEWTGESALNQVHDRAARRVGRRSTANEMIDQLLASETGSVLTSPQGDYLSRASPHGSGIFTEGEGRESGTVFFVNPTRSRPTAANFQYSFQMLNRPERGEAGTALSRGRCGQTVRLGGVLSGHWLVQELKGDSAKIPKAGCFIQIERVEYRGAGCDDGGRIRGAG
ncbi:MAG: hypothetical protein R3E58_08580 [Phycisphaerae bacterium]